MYAESRLWVVLHFQTQVLEVAWRGVDAGCTEALFTLGDKPELLYPQAKQEVGANLHLHSSRSSIKTQQGMRRTG